MRSLITLAVALTLFFNGFSQSLDPLTLSTNGTVQVIKHDGDTVFVGGDFTNIGFHAPYVSLIDPSTNLPVSDGAALNSGARVGIPDGNGGFYVGGFFTTVNGESQNRIVHLLPDLTVDGGFDCSLNSTVEALHLTNDHLYIGGNFTDANTLSVDRLIRVNPETGAVDASWLPQIDNGNVQDISAVGEFVYAGGSFTSVENSNDYRYLAQFSITSGEVQIFRSVNSTVEDLELDENTLFVGGSFSASEFFKSNLSFFDENNQIPLFSYNDVNSTVEVIEPDGAGGWYVGGAFTQFGSESTSRLIHVLEDGSLDPDFNSVNFNSSVRSLHLAGNDLYVGGFFTSVGSTSISRLARIDANSGELDETWVTNINNGTVESIAVVGNEVLIGGSFTEINGRNDSRYFAKLDINSGTLIPSPSLNSTVEVLVADGNTVYLGGSFSSGGIYQPTLGLVDKASGDVNQEFPDANGEINAIISDGVDGWYVGGSFSNIGGIAQSRIAHILSDFSVDPDFNCTVNSTVESLLLDGNNLYLGGAFTSINGVTLNRIARVNAQTGSPDSNWNPSPNSTVLDIADAGNDIFIGGFFSTINDLGNQRFLARLSKTTGEVVQTLSPNSNVQALENSDEGIYFGGSFTSVGYFQQSLARFSGNSPVPDPDFPYVNSTVEEIIDDGAGGYFACGAFFTANGNTQQRVIHILSDGSVDENFNPTINSTVQDIFLDGNDLYVAGSFSTINGSTFLRLARLDATTGEPDLTFNPEVNSNVNAVWVENGTVYFGGGFLEVNETPRARAAAVDLNGNLTSWDPAPNSTVEDIAFANGAVYLAGSFLNISGENRDRIAALNPTTGALTSFDPGNVNGTVFAMEFSGSSLFIGGSFSTVGGNTRQRFAELNSSTGALQPLNISFNSNVWDISVSGNLLALGGDFTDAGGNSRPYFAEIDLGSGTLTARNPQFDGRVAAIHYDGNDIITGGNFNYSQYRTIDRIAELDVTTNSLTTFDPGNCNSTVNDILLNNAELFVAGSFSNIGGESRLRFASLNAESGILNPLDIPLNNSTQDLKIDGNILYLAGFFTTVDGVERENLASIDLGSESVTDWNPSPDNTVNSLFLAGDDLILGGNFSYLNQVSTSRLAQFDMLENTMSTLIDGNTNGTINDLLLDGTDLYISGSFTNVAGESRNRFAIFDLSSETIDPLSIDVNNSVLTLHKNGNELYFGGFFSSVNGEPRERFAAFDLGSGQLLEFDPGFNSTVLDIESSNETVIVGGQYNSIGSETRNRVLSFDLTTTPTLSEFDPGTIFSTVRSLLVDGDDLYIGGDFNSVNGETRERLASLNKNNGALNPLSISINNGIYDLEKVGDELYLVGFFTEIEETERLRAASYNLNTSQLGSFNPKLDASARTIVSVPSGLWISGDFTRIGFEERNNFAAISAENNEILDLNTGSGFTNGSVFDIEFNENVIYLSGNFNQLNGENRNRLAAISRSDGSLLPFNPNVFGSSINDMVLDENSLYVGGSFTSIGGTAREDLAEINLPDGTVGDLNIPANSTIQALEISGSTLYVGGFFTQLDGQSRARLGAINLDDNTLTDLDGDANGVVYDILLDGGSLYVGGSFSSIGGESRNRLASLSTTDLSASAYNPDFNGQVNSIFIEENYLFAGGTFTEINGESAGRLTLIDKITGDVLLDFTPALNNAVNSVLYHNEKLYAGGSFTQIGSNFVHPRFARWSIPPPGSISFDVNLVSNTDFNGFDLACNGDAGGEIEISVSGGSAPFSYVLTNSDNSINRTGSINSSADSAIESDLPAGNYSVTVEDSQDGLALNNITLTQPDPFSANLDQIAEVTTAGGSEAELEIDIEGGIAPIDYSYTVDGGNEVQGQIADPSNPTLLSGLGAGNYVFEFTDANGCTTQASVSIDDYIPLDIQFTVFDGITCNGDDDGRIRIQIFDGIPPYDYVLDSDDDNFDRSGTFTFIGQATIENNLGPGVYNLEVIDATGAISTAGPLELTDPPLLMASVSVVSNTSAPGVNDGSIELMITGGSAGYSYTYTLNGSFFSSGFTNSTSTTINNLPAGVYVFTVTDQNGCEVITNSTEVLVGVDPCADLGGDTDNDGICDDLDPCPLLADLENGDNCGNNGIVVDCVCVEGCQVSLGAPTVSCLSNTNQTDQYQVSIPYSGIDVNATLEAGIAGGCDNTSISISGDNPATTENGTIILTTDEGLCWSITLSSDLCDLELSGTSPVCEPPPCGISLGTPDVICTTETDEDDEYTVSIPYFGIAPNATVTAGNTSGCSNPAITISGDDPTQVNSGIIVLTANENNSCWSISIQSQSCDIELEGSAPVCDPGPDCPGLGLDNGDPCGADGSGTVVDCQCLFPDCNGTLGGNVGDADGDEVCDDVDNCINTPNPDQDDLDVDGIGDVCDSDIDGDGVANANDCAPEDPNFAIVQEWYVDNDDDGFGNPDSSLIACEQPEGYVLNDDDCDDSNENINPDAQTLSFTGTGNFSDAVIFPQLGSPSTEYTFSVIYTDATGALPPLGFPRAILDFEGNGNFNNPNDRTILLTPANSNDLNTTDGKLYTGSISSLTPGTSYTTRIRVASGDCLTEIGPFDYPDVLTEPDLEIFADDITFSNINPDISSPLEVSAVIRNTSDLPASNFTVDLVNQFDESIDYPEIVVPFLQANSTTVVTWDIVTPDVPAWCPMEVFVDNTDVVNETNELDNRAVRPFVNGDFEVPGDIISNVNVSPAVQVAQIGATVTVFGFSEYIDTAIPLDDPSVAGGTVTLETEQGATYTGLTNSQGYFSITFPAPQTPGIYTVDGEVTDFTLTGDFTVQFEITEPINVCLPDLRATVDLFESQIFIGESTGGTVTVSNTGCSASEVSTLLDITQTGGTPVLSDEVVPPLEPGESIEFDLDELTFNQAGSYLVCGTADANFVVEESNEANNTGCDGILVVPPLPDIYPIAGPVGSAFLCTNPSNPGFTIVNGGYVPSGSFEYEIDAFYEGVFQETFEGVVNNLNPNQSTNVSIPFSYDQIGNYSFEIRCDVPLPNGIVEEINETNNVGNYSRTILECLPDLKVLGCRELEVDPVDPEFPGEVTYVARVRNNGNAEALQPINFEFQVSNGESYSITIDQDMAPGEEVEVTTQAPTVQSGSELLTGVVDPDDFIVEFSEINNSYSDSLCWEFAPVPKCGSDFWNFTYAPFQTATISVGLDVDFLYKASAVSMRFEVEGPGISGTALLGDVAVENVETTCNCPYVVSLPNTFLFTEVGTYTFTFTADPENEYAECDEGNNVLQVEVEVTTLPDMRILSEFINPTVLNPALGESVFFDVTYENIGVSNPPDEMDLQILVDEVELTTIENVSGLLQGTNTTIAIPTPYSTTIGGAHIVRAIIDSNDEIEESNELNNEATRAIVVGEAANLFFASFVPDDASPEVGQNIAIDAVIGNNGSLDVSADVLFSYVNNAGDTVQIGSIPVDVETGGSQAISLPWNVLDNNTELLGEIVNASEIEFNYDDNFASANLGSFDVVITSIPFCEGENEGSLTASADGGNPPYTYSWSNGFVGETLVAAPGTYSVTVTDDEGFEATASGTIGVDPTCTEPECNLSAVSFNVPQNCNPETGIYEVGLTVAYENEPQTGSILVNGETFEITGSPQSFVVEFDEGNVSFAVSFSDNEDCSLNIMTGVNLDPCEQDCEGVFGGDALPGEPCTIGGENGVYNENCVCIPTIECSLVVNSFDLDENCDPETGLYGALVELVYSDAPIEGSLVVNGVEFEITQSPQTVETFFESGPVEFEAFFTEAPECNALLTTPIILEPCIPDCEGVFGGDALPGTPCIIGGLDGIYNFDCECVPTGVCDVDGGEITTDDPLAICKGDGIPDPITVTLNGAQGENSAWLVTGANGLIVDITTDNVFDFENTTGTGICVIWHLSWQGEITGLELGGNAFELEGDCFDLSNSIEVFELFVDGGEITLEGDTTFCIDDGEPDSVAVSVAGNSGPKGRFVLTDTELNVIGSSETGVYDFEGFPEGTYLIWYGAYGGVIDGFEIGANVADLEGCFALSNSIAITLEECDEPIIADCDNWRYFLSDNTSNGNSDIYEVVLDDENEIAELTTLKSLEYPVHIAYRQGTDELFLVRSTSGSFRILDVSTPDGALSAEIPLDISVSGAVTATFDASGNFFIGVESDQMIYEVDPVTGTTTEYAEAEIQGGDIAFGNDGELYLVSRIDEGRAFRIVPDGENELLGSVPNLVTGLASRNDGNLMISTNDRSKFYVGDTDADNVDPDYVLIKDGEVFTMSNGDMASGCGDIEPIVQSCNAQVYYYANHGPGISGTDIYEMELEGEKAMLSHEINLPYQAHIAHSDDESNLLYFVNANGDFLEIYDPSIDVSAQVDISGDIDQLYAVVFNPFDGLLYVGDDGANEIYTIEPLTGITEFFADAPISGGDLTLLDGELYLAKRNSDELYIYEDSSFELVGNIPDEVNGMCASEMLTDLIVASAESGIFSRIKAEDGSLIETYEAELDGLPFTLSNGDLASGCIDPDLEPVCAYQLFYAHQGSDGMNALVQMDLQSDGTVDLTELAFDVGDAHIAILPNGFEMFVVDGSGSFRIFDLTSQTFSESIDIYTDDGTISATPAAVCTPEGFLIVASSNRDRAYLVNPATGYGSAIGREIPVAGGDLVFDNEGNLWYVNRNTGTFYDVYVEDEFDTPLSEINGAALLDDGKVLLAEGNDENIMYTVDMELRQLDEDQYEMPFNLYWGDLTGQCLDIAFIPSLNPSTSQTAETQGWVEAYPNPNRGEAVFTFQTAVSGLTTLEVFDLRGRKVQELFHGGADAEITYRVEMSRPDLPDGIYIYRLTNQREIKTGKFIIAR